MAYLTVIAADGRTFRRDIEADRVTIGRSSKNDVNLSFDLSLSRTHAEVVRRDDRFFLNDVGSRNGTSLNGRQVTQPTELNVGDQISLGETRIVFSAEGGPKVALEDRPPVTADSSTMTIPLEEIISNPMAVSGAPTKTPTQASPTTPENRTLAVLTRAGMELIDYKPLDEVFEAIMDLVFEAIPAERGFLMLLEGDVPSLVSKVVRDLKKSYGGTISLSRSIAHSVVENRQSVLTTDAQSDERFKMKESIVLQGIHSAMCVPLWNNRAVIGLIYVDTINAAKTFSPEDLKLLTLLANIAAVKIENARLFEDTLARQRMEKELQQAAAIQRKLLPTETPAFAGYDLAGYNFPCREVGGDYFDFIQRGDKRLGFAIGDVSGKGMGAALLMATVRASFRAHLEAPCTLESLASSLNNTILTSANSNNFVSFFYGELDGPSGRLDFVNAGHNPPFLVRAGGTVERLKANGLILGVFPGARHQASTASLSPGDMLVAFSDGVTESQNTADEEFGEERFCEILLRDRNLPASGIQDQVAAAIKAFAGAEPQYDDVTLVVLKRIS